MFEESAILSTLPTLPFLGYLSCLMRCSIFQKAFIYQMLDSLSTPGLFTILDDLNDFWAEQMDVVLSASQANGIFFHSTSGIWSQGHISDLSLEFLHFSNLKSLYPRKVLTAMCHHPTCLVLQLPFHLLETQRGS